MPNLKSSIKAMRVSRRRNVINTRVKDKYKDELKTFRKLVAEGKKDEAQKAISKVASALDKAVKKNVIHKNKASRLKSRMAKAVVKLSA